MRAHELAVIDITCLRDGWDRATAQAWNDLMHSVDYARNGTGLHYLTGHEEPDGVQTGSLRDNG